MKGQPQPQSQEMFGDRWNLIPIMASASNLHRLMSNFFATEEPRLRFLIWREGGKRERVRLS
jgi:hypothetical protein